MARLISPHDDWCSPFAQFQAAPRSISIYPPSSALLGSSSGTHAQGWEHVLQQQQPAVGAVGAAAASKDLEAGTSIHAHLGHDDACDERRGADCACACLCAAFACATLTLLLVVSVVLMSANTT